VVIEMGNKAKILIIDDQEGIRQLLAETCLMLGYEVKTAANGQEAYDLVCQEDFQVAFVDMKMSGINGYETMKLIREKRKGLKGVFMTGYDEPDHELKSEMIVLIKPFNLEKVKEVLEKLLK
jgi:two-component system response regulator (stage 0 sporulation protein F)